MVRRLSRLVVWGLSGLLLAAGAGAQKPAETDSERTLRELLDEVRLLRQVLQATSVGSVRAQILLTQRQLHNERILQIERQLSAARSEQAERQSQISQFEDRIAEIEQVSRSETDAGRRAAYESETQQLTRARDRTKEHQDVTKARETELTESLSHEQTESDRIQRDLDRIEKDLDELQSRAPRKP